MAHPLAIQQRWSAGEVTCRNSPERQAIRQFLDFMRIGDTDSAYQAVEKMNFSDFVDALEAVHAKENSQKASK